MTNLELEQKLSKLILEERKISHEILVLINIALERRCYLDRGFSSMFDWLVNGFGYSNAAAYRRIEAAQLLRVVPEIEEKLKSGDLNLSTLSKAQSVIRAHEKASGEKVSDAEKKNIVEEIENKSVHETEQLLVARFPETASSVHQERRTVIDENTNRHQMNLSVETTADLDRLKSIMSHKMPNASDADIIAFAVKQLLNKLDPMKDEVTSAAEVNSPSTEKTLSRSKIRILKFKEAKAACTYRDPMTGRTCGSQHQLEIDHIQPKALGGSDDPENLRVLCRQHNLMMAERAFGKTKMNQYRR